MLRSAPLMDPRIERARRIVECEADAVRQVADRLGETFLATLDKIHDLPGRVALCEEMAGRTSGPDASRWLRRWLRALETSGESTEVRLQVVERVPRCPVPARDVDSGRYDRGFARALVEAKAATRIGQPLDRGELYTASVFTRVLTPSATLSVA